MNKKQYRILSSLLGLTILLFFINIFFPMRGQAPHGQANNTASSSFGVNISNGVPVALIKVEGPISASTSDFVLSSLRKISAESGVKGLLIKINSPGGTTGTSQEIYNEVMKIRKSGIKVVSFIGDLGASGGYYIASASDIIVANASSLTGSIGVIISTMNFQGIADKVGVKSINFTSGSMKDMLSPFRDLRPDEVAYIKKMINDIYKQFVADVLAGRNGSMQKISPEQLMPLADGRIITGVDAKKEGLIDVLGGFSVAQEEMKKLLKAQNISFKTFSKSYLEQALSTLGANAKSLASISSPMSSMSSDLFLKEHLHTPLYYSSVGGF